MYYSYGDKGIAGGNCGNLLKYAGGSIPKANVRPSVLGKQDICGFSN